MSLSYYMDVHVHAAVTDGLRIRGIDVLTAQEDGSRRLSDAEIMTRATDLGRVLYSQDGDMLVEAAKRQRSGESFSGLVYSRRQEITVGRAIQDLHLIAEVYAVVDMINRVEFLPL